MTDEFAGFPQDGLDFLAQLGGETKDWFAANRSRYTTQLVEPTKAFVEVLGDRLLAEFSPTIIAQPKTNGSIAPINNDLRFSADKPPYKDHLLLRFWDGPNKKTAPMVLLRIAPDRIGFSAGAGITSVDRWRDLVDDDTTGPEIAELLAPFANKADGEIAGDQLKRVPKPFADDHPRADLLRRKGVVYVRWAEPTPLSITTPGFVGYCMERFGEFAALHQWFCTHLRD